MQFPDSSLTPKTGPETQILRSHQCVCWGWMGGGEREEACQALGPGLGAGEKVNYSPGFRDAESLPSVLPRTQ